MTNSVEHYISELLFTHDCIIVMGFGGFIGNKNSARLNPSAGIITPPGKSILFNTELKENDGILIDHIVKNEKISHEKAKKITIKFVNENLIKLKKYKSLRINKIGIFTLNSDGKIIFSQDLSINYNLDSFGLPSTLNKKILRSQKTEIKDTITKIKKIQNFSGKKLLKVAAILLPLISISFLSVTQEDKINNLYTQMASLLPITDAKTINIQPKEIINTINQPTIDIKKNNINIKEVTITTEETPVFSKSEYYIIAGAFGEKENAKKLVARLSEWNYNSSIVNDGNNKIMRVCYSSYSVKEKALSDLKKIRTENPDAWILSL